MDVKIHWPDMIGSGYRSFWNCRKRYRVNKGGRGSKKSCNAAIWFVWHMMYYWHRHKVKPNLLVVRRYWNTHKDSTRAQLVWAINRLGFASLWNIPKSELTLTYKPSGQQILFRGMDDPQSLTSITVSDGHLCWVWWEEAFQITNEDDFDKVDMSIRGELPAPLFKQHTLTLNPWSDKHWIKRRFFDLTDDDTLSITTTYKQNEFLPADDIAVFEKMRQNNPRRYAIEGDGEWGIAEGLIFSNWTQEAFNIDALVENTEYRGLYGLDFGYNDPSAFVAMRFKPGDFVLYVYDEFYQSTMNNKLIADTLITKGYRACKIMADSEDPRTINELKTMGLSGIRGAAKGPGSVLGGIQKLQDYKIIVHPRCQNVIVALSNYAWETDRKSGQIVNKPQHDFSHIPDAMRYAMEDIGRRGVQYA